KKLCPMIVVRGAAIGFNKENRFVASRAVGKICFQPVHKTGAVMDIARINSPFQTMRIAVRTSRKCRREPALQSQKRLRWKSILFIPHEDAHCEHARDGEYYHRRRRLPAGTEPAALEARPRSDGVSPRSHDPNECKERHRELQSASAGFPDARQGA